MSCSSGGENPWGSRSRAEVVNEMVRVLGQMYGGEAWDRRRESPDPLEAIVRTILSQNTNDQNRDLAYQELRARFSTWEAVLAAPREAVAEAIRVGGLANYKARYIQEFLGWLNEYQGALRLGFICDMPTEEAVRMLTARRGVGIKTAYIVMAFACNRDLCAVDTHVHRILQRVGVIDRRCGREKAHLELALLIPEGKARSFHVDLLDFGKDICTARKPSCAVCPLSGLCVYYQTGAWR